MQLFKKKKIEADEKLVDKHVNVLRDLLKTYIETAVDAFTTIDLPWWMVVITIIAGALLGLGVGSLIGYYVKLPMLR